MRTLLMIMLLPIISYSQSSLEEVEQLLEKKDFAKAEKFMESYVKKHPNDLKGIELLGDTYGAQLKWESAMYEYKKLVDAKPKNADYHYKYGGAMGLFAKEVNKFKALGMLDDIKDAFHTSANLDAKHIDARWALVHLYMELPGIVGGSMKKSLKYAEELEYLSKVDGYLAKGFIYEKDDDYEKAEHYYKKALAVGGSLTCFKTLAQLYVEQDKLHLALNTLEECHNSLQTKESLHELQKFCSDNKMKSALLSN